MATSGLVAIADYGPGLSLNLAVVGPYHGPSGKSSLIRRFVAGYFRDLVCGGGYDLDHTGNELQQGFRRVEIHGNKVKLKIKEVRGEFNDSTLYGTHGIMHVYDITAGGEGLQDLLKGCVHILVGTRCDLEVQRRVSKEHGREWAAQHYGGRAWAFGWGCDCHFMEVSAKTGVNVDRAFYTLARGCLIHRNILDWRVALPVPHQDRLTDACESGDFETVLDLLSEGCDPNCMGYSTPLHCACQHNQPTKTIKNVLKYCNPAQRDWCGNTPLHIAAQLGRIDIVKYLVSAGQCNPSDTNVDGQNCLHIVCKAHHEKVVQCRIKEHACNVDASGRDGTHWVCKSHLLSILKYFINVGHCNPSARDSRGKNCLYHACEAGCEYLVDYLLRETECSIEKGSNLGRECLRHACYYGLLNMVEHLVSNREYDPRCYTKHSRRNCLHIACGRGHLEVVKYLANVMECDPNCLHIACEVGYVEIVKYLVIERQCDPNVYVQDDHQNNVNCLQMACSHNHADVVEFLISQPQCYVNKTAYPVGNCLFWACKNGHLEIAKYLVNMRHCNPYASIPFRYVSVAYISESESEVWQQQNCVHVAIANAQMEIVKFLLVKSECDVSYKEKAGWTYLHWACQFGFLDIVKYLIVMRHCNPNDCNVKNQNCLHIACEAGEIDVLKYLIRDKGCDPNCPDGKGRNCLHIASNANKRDIVEFLVSENHCNPNDKDMEGQTCLHLAYYKQCSFVTLEYLIRSGTVDVNEKNKNGNNCLLWACEEGYFDIIKYLITERHCDTTVTNPEGQNGLHIACQQGHIDIVMFLVSGKYCNPNSKDKDGQNSLHTAYCCISYDFQKREGRYILIVEYLISIAAPLCFVEVDEKDKNGSNCLLWACKLGLIDIVEYLITDRHCNTTVTNALGQNCLHIACQQGRIDIVKFLVSGGYCNPNSKDNDGQNALHTAYCCVKRFQERYLEIVEYLISLAAPLSCVKVDEKDKNGRTCFQWAFEEGCIDIAEYLICSRHCNVGEYAQTCIQLASRHDRVDIVRSLTSQGHWDPFAKNEIGLTGLHVVAAVWDSVEIVQYLVEEVGIDPSSTDNLGQTPLHHASRQGHHAVVRYLLSTGRVNVFLRDSHGNTALDLAISRYGIELISDAEVKYKRQLVPHKPPEPSVSVFIVGYPSVGKTTLVTALTREASGLSALPGFFLNVSADLQTAGIIPTDFVSKIYGRVTFFDLAGQNQYYASHAAVIQNAISSAAPVFLLVVKLPETEEDIKQRIFYWLAFLENQCKQLEAKPHIIIVGSHADSSQAVEETTRRRLWKYFQTVSCCESFSLIDFIPLDCRKSESAGVSQLRQRLKTSCDALRREESMEIHTHCLLVYLVQKVSAVSAISLQQLSEAIHVGKLNEGPLQHEDLLQADHLYHMCDKLHACGHILFLKNERNPDDSWVIMNKEALLSHITGTIFAPKQFKEHREDLASSTGVVPISKLAAHFPDFNVEMIVQFLTHLEFCHEVSDCEVIEMIYQHEKESSKSVPATSTAQNSPSETPERYLFFPALVSVETPITPLWEEDSRFTYQSGWLLKCSQPDHFFMPRFLQVLLLRLAFSFALAPDSCDFQADLPVLRRKCSIWKNGIYWVNMDGVAALVEMDRHSRELCIFMRCLNGSEVKCANLRSAIIHNILRAIAEFCPKVDTLEYLIHPTDIQYPMPQSRELTLFSMNSIAKAVLQSQPAAVNDAQKLATIEELLYFEPYADIGEAIISELFDEENPSYSAVVSDGFLYTIADRVHPKQTLFEKMLDLPASSVEFYQSQAPPGPAHAMGHLLVCWKEHGDGSRQCLRQKLDQFSVFAGRSPLQLVSIYTHTVFLNVATFF